MLSPSTADLHNPITYFTGFYQARGMTLHLYVTLRVPGPRDDLTPLQGKLCKLWGKKRPLQSQNSPTQAGILHVS